MKKHKHKMIMLKMIDMDQDLTTIAAKRGGDKNWVHFRGDGYHQWTAGPLWKHKKTPAQLIHDALLGWHACVLHAGDTLSIFDNQSDYAAVDAMISAADVN